MNEKTLKAAQELLDFLQDLSKRVSALEKANGITPELDQNSPAYKIALEAIRGIRNFSWFLREKNRLEVAAVYVHFTPNTVKFNSTPEQNEIAQCIDKLGPILRVGFDCYTTGQAPDPERFVDKVLEFKNGSPQLPTL